MSLKIYPSVEELSVSASTFVCPECHSIFKSEPNLNLHRTKTHNVSLSLSKNGNSSDKSYHCPIGDCSKTFRQYKLLKQHFMKVHGEKKFICETCNRGFATMLYKNRHIEYCNVTFKCCDCASSYGSYETLITHCRRKKHKFLKKERYKPNFDQTPQFLPDKKFQLILPKCTNRPNNICEVIFKKNMSTQTTDVGQRSINMSTQTDFITDSHTSTSDLLISDTFDSNYFNCNTETQTDFMLNDELFKDCDYYSNMHTQTCEDLLLEFSHSQTQTPFDLKSAESQTISLTNMETQTDAEFQQFLNEINS